MARKIFWTPEGGWRRNSDRRRQQLRAAKELKKLADAKCVRRKRFGVRLCHSDGREDLRMYSNKRNALYTFQAAARIAANGMVVADGDGGCTPISITFIYEVDCADEETARRKINQSQARLIGDSVGLPPDIVIHNIFKTRH